MKLVLQKQNQKRVVGTTAMLHIKRVICMIVAISVISAMLAGCSLSVSDVRQIGRSLHKLNNQPQNAITEPPLDKLNRLLDKFDSEEFESLSLKEQEELVQEIDKTASEELATIESLRSGDDPLNKAYDALYNRMMEYEWLAKGIQGNAARVKEILQVYQQSVELALKETDALDSITTVELPAPAGTKEKYTSIMRHINRKLDNEKYSITETITYTSPFVTQYAGTEYDGVRVYQTAKHDLWGRPFFVIFDANKRNPSANVEFFVTIVSAGPDGVLDVAGSIGDDDVFSVTQYSDGSIASVSYDWSEEGTRPKNASGATATTYAFPNWAPVIIHRS